MLQRLNISSVAYTGNVTFPADSRRGYFMVVASGALATVELGRGGGKVPLELGGHYQPRVTPISEITIEGVDFIVITDSHATAG